MSHLRTTILVSLVSFAIYSAGSSILYLEEVPDSKVEGYVVLNVPTEYVIPDLSLLCLGSLGNLDLVKEVGYTIGMKLKDLGIDAYVFGTLDTLSPDDRNPLARVSSSPYITARVLEYLYIGLSAAGVLPVLRAGEKIDLGVLGVLESRRLFLPVFVENEDQMKRLKRLGYDTVFLNREGFIDQNPISLNWRGSRRVDVESLRKEVLRRSIVLLNPRGSGVVVNDPFSLSKVLVFSDDDWLLELAREVDEGKIPATGRKP